MTGLFNLEFSVFRLSGTYSQGMPDESLSDTGIKVLGRFSSPTYREREAFQNRELPLTTKIYCEPYAYDAQKDVLFHDGTYYSISEIVPTRSGASEVHHLQIYAAEKRDGYGS